MSRILKSKKKLIFAVAFVLSAVMLLYNVWIAFILLLFLAMLFLNRYVLIKQSKKVSAVLHGRHEIIKITTLIIGDVCSSSILRNYKRGNTLEIVSPGRSFEASKMIFLHVESLLEEGDRLVLINNKNIPNGYTQFDLPYLNTITKKELGIEDMEQKRKYPLLYSPIKSMMILLGVSSRNYRKVECPDNMIKTFCYERNIELIYLEK